MSLANYGEHAERAADALSVLVRADHVPALDDQVVLMLNARESVVSAINDRLRNHLVDLRPAPSDPAARVPVTLARLTEEPVTELAVSAAQLPRLQASDRLSPIDVHGSKPTDPGVAAWLTAGSELLAANHVLDRAEETPWRTDPASRLALAADTAQIVEAVTVLDHRLDEVGIFAGRLELAGAPIRTPYQSRDAARATTRLIASHLDRLGQQYGESTQTDLTAIKTPRPIEFREPIVVVHHPGDLASAQRQLTTVLTPLATRDLLTIDRLSAMTANTIGVGHKTLIKELHDRLASSPGLRDQLPRLNRLQDLHDEARFRVSGLHDMTAPRINKTMRHQQQEISVAVKDGKVRRLSDHQALDLLSATEGAVSTWASAIAREGQRSSTDLRIIRRIKFREVRYGRMKPDGPAVQALTALAQYKPIVPVSTHLLPTRDRNQLREALTRAPLGERPAHLRAKPPSRSKPGLGR